MWDGGGGAGAEECGRGCSAAAGSGRSTIEGARLREGALDCLEHDVAREGAREATREMPRAAAREVARPSGLGCATPRRLPRWCASSLVEFTSVERCETFEPFEWAYEYGWSMSWVL